MKNWKNKGSIQPQCEILMLFKSQGGTGEKRERKKWELQKYEFYMEKYSILIQWMRSLEWKSIWNVFKTEIFLLISRKICLVKWSEQSCGSERKIYKRMTASKMIIRYCVMCIGYIFNENNVSFVLQCAWEYLRVVTGVFTCAAVLHAVDVMLVRTCIICSECKIEYMMQ